jgi:hypothetical protein
LREAFAALDEKLRAEVCPEPGLIWDAVHARGAPARVRQVIEHTAACPSCAADWRVAMESELRGSVERIGRSHSSFPTGWTRFAAAAAIILAAFVFGVSRVGDPTPGIPVYRTADEFVLRSLLPAGEPLSRDQALLRWSEIGEGALFDVEVGTLELAPLASARDLEETEFSIPAEALDSVADGESIVWQVEAILPDGRHVASEAFITRLE